MPGGFPSGLELCNCNDQGTVLGNAQGTPITCGNGAYGSFTQLVASTPFDTAWMIVLVAGNRTTAMSAQQGTVEIAVGASGSEKVIIHDLMFCNLSGSSGQNMSAAYSFPCHIPAGTRISAAGYCLGATDIYSVAVLLFDGAFTQMEGCAGVDSIGGTGGAGTSLAGTAGAKGAYSQLIASSARDYIGFVIATDDLGNQGAGYPGDIWLIDVAIGASGSEKVIFSNYEIGVTASGSSFTGYQNGVSPFIPVPIPAGTRIAARTLAANGNSIGVTVYGVYL